MEQTCRVCLKQQTEMVYIFNESSDISSKIKLITSVQISRDDNYPKYMCKKCENDLYIAINLRETCIATDIKLQSNELKKNNELVLFDSSETAKSEDDACSLKSEIEFIDKPYVQSNKKSITNLSQNRKRKTKMIPKKLPTTYKCPECALDFSTKFKYNQHVTEAHPDQIKELKIYSSHQCEICGKFLKYRVELQLHLRRHNGEKPYKCEKCDKSYVSKNALSKHLAKHSGQNQKHECNLCWRQFQFESNLKTHLKVHNNEKRFPCNLCHKKFKYNRTLLLHIKIHTNERNYPCAQCDKAFVNRFDLSRHLKRHEIKAAMENGTYDPQMDNPQKEVIPQQCEICGYICYANGDLRKHKRCHSSERPFKCSLCEKGFKTPSAMRMHEKTHSKIKPYVCQQCGKNFSQSSNLKIHERLHTGAFPFKCQICEKSFNRKRDLLSHQKKHSVDFDK